MPKLIDGKVTFQGGEQMPSIGTPEYDQVSRGILPGSKPASSPVATPIAPLTDRYPAEKKAIAENPAMNIDQPSERKIRDQYRGYAQGIVNTIRSQFDKYIQEDTEAKKLLESRAHLTSLAGGLSGSPSGATNTYKAAEKGQEKVRQTTAERDALISKVIADSDMRASSEYHRQREEYLGAAEDKYRAEEALRGNVKTAAENELKTYAQNRTFDEWSKEAGPERVKRYMEETGMDEMSLKSFFLMNTPKEELVNESGTKLGDGSIVWYRKNFDDAGNLTGVTEVARINGGADGKTIKDSRITDEGVQILYTDGTYVTKRADGSTDGGGESSSGGKQVQGAPKGVTESALEEARRRLNVVGAYEGYANAYLYRDLYDDWIDKGGSRDTFIKYFPPKTYINPAHNELIDPETDSPLLPDYLRSTAKPVKAPTVVKPTSSTSSSGRSF